MTDMNIHSQPKPENWAAVLESMLEELYQTHYTIKRAEVRITRAIDLAESVGARLKNDPLLNHAPPRQPRPDDEIRLDLRQESL